MRADINLDPGNNACVGSSLFIGPLPVGDLFSIDAELVSVISASDLLVEQCFANAGGSDSETRHAIDCINGQAEAISLVPDS